MVRFYFIVLVSFFAFGVPSVSSAEDSIKQDFSNFLNSGCPTNKLVTQVETRILKNVPYAVLGYQFKSADLRFLYSHNGGWYKASTSTLPKLSSKEQACVDQLAAREKVLKQKYKIDPEIKAVLSRSSKLYFEMRKHLGQNPDARFVTETGGRKTKTSWHWFLVDKSACGGSGSPEEADECSGVALMCDLPQGTQDWKKLQCVLSFAG